MNNKVCFGCGVKLQNTDSNKKGYTPKIDASYCMRCFRMIHYGENAIVDTPKEVKEIINKINKDDKFVLFLCDFLNINNDVIKIFKSIKCKKMMIINKCELMPKTINKNTFASYIKDNYKIKDEVKLKGGTKNHGAKSILEYLTSHNIKSAYVLGISNSGKSTLINDLMDLCGTNKNKIAVNRRANTTLDFLRVKLNEQLTIIDSPGFIIKNSLDVDAYNKGITAYSFNIKAGDTLSLIDNKYYVKFDSDTKIVFYTNVDANKVVKKYYRAAEGLKYCLDINNYEDLVITGLGYMYIKNKCKISTNIPLNYLETRSSMFGGPNE